MQILLAIVGDPKLSFFFHFPCFLSVRSPTYLLAPGIADVNSHVLAGNSNGQT
jgi:hypothetical protein